jgi:D-alanine-D-alanine ligase-like ATP-grasp enzyme
MFHPLHIRSAFHRCRILFGKLNRDARRAKKGRAEFYRQLWQQAAVEAKAHVSFESGDLLVVRRGAQQAKLFRNYTDLDGPVTLRAVGDKVVVHQMLQTGNVPTPPYRAFTLRTIDSAQAFIKQHALCVVKPASGTGAGAGVTTGVDSRKSLHAAAARATAFDSRLVIEKQIPGRNLRLLFLDGQLLDAVERRPPTITGDGKSTIQQLIDLENRRRCEAGIQHAQVLLDVDLDVRRTLARQGLSLKSIPSAQQSLAVKTVINDNAADENVSVLDSLCGDIVSTARNAAALLGVRLAGVDVLTHDLAYSLQSTGGVILEVNTTPGLYIHKSKPVSQIAVPILEACLAQFNQSPRAADVLEGSRPTDIGGNLVR